MAPEIPRETVARLSDYLKTGMGLYFPEDRWDDLRKKMARAMKDFDDRDLNGFIERLLSSPLSRQEIEILAGHLTISETYFWREPRVFEALIEGILPELIRQRQEGEKALRIWSAGCASGEESYSLAIALSRVLPVRKDWRITILATDINPRVLARAAEGLYGPWSFRGSPAWVKEGYFRCKGDGRLEIIPEIRKMVAFAYLNLSEDVYPSPLNNTSAMDIVFCRNVLMYFTPERACQVGQRLYSALVDRGWLVVGASELSQFTFPQFKPVHFPGAIVYRKEMTGVGAQVSGSLPLEGGGFGWGWTMGSSPSPQSPPLEGGENNLKGRGPGVRHQEFPPLGKGGEGGFEHDASDWHRGPGVRARGSGVGNLDIPSRQVTSVEVITGPVPGQYETASGQRESEKAAIDATLLIRKLADRGRLAEALSACYEAIAENKLDPEMHYLLAIILHEQSRDDEAIASLKRALYLDPDLAPAHFAMGNLMLRRGNGRAARKCFENVLTLLDACRPEEVLAEFDGLTAGRCREIINATLQIGLST